MTTQLGLLAWSHPAPSPHASEQGRELARVGGRIGEALLAWCRSNVGRQFHLEELTAEVQSRVTCAPDSARRILGQLRKEGRVSVSLLSRSGSLYRAEGCR